MIALRVSSALSFESMKSTTTLRPPSPPLLLMYFPNPRTASREPANAPGASGVSTSAITAIRISVGVTPTSVACGASLLESAAPAPGTPAASTLASTVIATVTASARRRARIIVFPPSPGRVSAGFDNMSML